MSESQCVQTKRFFPKEQKDKNVYLRRKSSETDLSKEEIRKNGRRVKTAEAKSLENAEEITPKDL